MSQWWRARKAPCELRMWCGLEVESGWLLVQGGKGLHKEDPSNSWANRHASPDRQRNNDHGPRLVDSVTVWHHVAVIHRSACMTQPEWTIEMDRDAMLESFDATKAHELLRSTLPESGHSVVVAMRPKGGKAARAYDSRDDKQVIWPQGWLTVFDGVHHEPLAAALFGAMGFVRFRSHVGAGIVLVHPLRIALNDPWIAGGEALTEVTARQLKLDSHPRRTRCMWNVLGNYDNVQYHVQIEIGAACPSYGRQQFKVRTKWDVIHVRIGNRITFRYGDGTVANGGAFLKRLTWALFFPREKIKKTSECSFYDTVRIGDLEVQRQLLIQVDDMESDTHMKSDGILGLAHHYASDRSLRGETFVSTLFREHPHLPAQFSFYLTGRGSSDAKSQLVFGDPDLGTHSKETSFRYGKGQYMSTTDLWLTSVWSIGWSDTGVEVTFPDRGTLGAPALIDSGSSLLVIEPTVYDRLISELRWRFTNCHSLPEQQILSCDCPPANDLSRIPQLVINVIDEHVRDKQFSLCMSPDEFILESVDPLTGRTSCVPSIQRGSDSQPVPLIFGMTCA
ncbi:unnamed protein product [Durusdinium trenchii]|uniref:Peptidase A1 domain-containing protein n=1 Tax=Durusdinium trenchii TaxID=1381693 RepID=A0ABP0KB74_9DINO